jgi:predicted methyltransferase
VTDKPSSRKIKFIIAGVLGLCAVVAAGVAYFVGDWNANREAEVAELEKLLQLGPGMAVAEIGAGNGQMTVWMAQRLGPESKMFTTEIDTGKLADIRKAVASAGLENVTAVEAGKHQTNLPAHCCDAVFMRRVYHHFTDIAAITASLYETVRPGGRLAVIDFEPRAAMPRPDGVPENRDGHGVPLELVIEELTAAGFEVEHRSETWSGRDFIAVFRKPSAPDAPASPDPG